MPIDFRTRDFSVILPESFGICLDNRINIVKKAVVKILCAYVKQRLIVFCDYRIGKSAAAFNRFQKAFFGIGSQIHAFGGYRNSALEYHLVKRYICIEYILRGGRGGRFGYNIGVCRRICVSVAYCDFFTPARKCRKHFFYILRHSCL